MGERGLSGVCDDHGLPFSCSARGTGEGGTPRGVVWVPDPAGEHPPSHSWLYPLLHHRNPAQEAYRRSVSHAALVVSLVTVEGCSQC